MASLTRSDRRQTPPTQDSRSRPHRERQPCLPIPHHDHPPHVRHAAPHACATAPQSSVHQHISRLALGRTKRGLSASSRDRDALQPKRARIAVEILAKPQPITHDAVGRPPPPRGRTSGANVRSPAQPATPTVPNSISQQSAPRSTSATLTKHQQKVRKGIQHELSRLQPGKEEAKEEAKKPSGRKLRSQEATRFKSELSAYFPDYDEVVGNEPKEQHLLNYDTPTVCVDTGRLNNAISALPPDPTYAHAAVRGFGDALFTEVVDAQRIDFSFLETQFKNKTLQDPLPRSIFEGVHKRAERLERSIRNTERGRAQHEKDQIIRLLEGLQGHDWLRVMGISGITESKKKSFEPAREHFIRGCQAIIDKFKNWTIEEKRRKHEKERALAEEAEDLDEEEREPGGTKHSRDETTPDDSSDASSQAGISDASSPAKQLREEALARVKAATKGPKRRRSTVAAAPPKPPEPPKEFTSFFSKRYERDSALHRSRRTGRKALAWGLPMPDMADADFDLPEAYRDEDTMKSRARKKRKEKRRSKA